jgi:hypothetical protein
VLDGDGAARDAERDRPLNLVAQLPYVAGPQVLREQVEDRRAQLDIRLSEAFARLAEEIAGQMGYFLAPLA